MASAHAECARFFLLATKFTMTDPHLSDHLNEAHEAYKLNDFATCQAKCTEVCDRSLYNFRDPFPDASHSTVYARLLAGYQKRRFHIPKRRQIVASVRLFPSRQVLARTERLLGGSRPNGQKGDQSCEPTQGVRFCTSGSMLITFVHAFDV